MNHNNINNSVFLKDDIIRITKQTGEIDEYPIMDILVVYFLQDILNPKIVLTTYYNRRLKKWFFHSYGETAPYFEFNFYNKYEEQNRGPHPYPKGSIVEVDGTNVIGKKSVKKFKITDSYIMYISGDIKVYYDPTLKKFINDSPSYNTTDRISLIKSSHHILQKGDKVSVNNKEHDIVKVEMDYFIKLDSHDGHPAVLLTIKRKPNGTYYFETQPNTTTYSIHIRKAPYNANKTKRKDTFFQEGDEVIIRRQGYQDTKLPIFNRRPRYFYVDSGIQYEVYRMEKDLRWMTTQNNLAFVEFIINPKIARKLDNPDLANTIPSLKDLEQNITNKYRAAGITDRNVVATTLEQKEDYDQGKLLNILESSKFVLVPTQKEKIDINKLSSVTAATVQQQNVEGGTENTNYDLRISNPQYSSLIDKITSNIPIGQVPNWVKSDAYRYKLFYNALITQYSKNIAAIIGQQGNPIMRLNRVLYNSIDPTNFGYMSNRYKNKMPEYNNRRDTNDNSQTVDVEIFSKSPEEIEEYLNSYDNFVINVFDGNLTDDQVETILIYSLSNDSVQIPLLNKIFSYVPYYDLTVEMQNKLDEARQNSLLNGPKIGWAIGALNWKPANQQKQQESNNQNQWKNRGNQKPRQGGQNNKQRQQGKGWAGNRGGRNRRN